MPESDDNSPPAENNQVSTSFEPAKPAAIIDQGDGDEAPTKSAGLSKLNLSAALDKAQIKKSEEIEDSPEPSKKEPKTTEKPAKETAKPTETTPDKEVDGLKIKDPLGAKKAAKKDDEPALDEKEIEEELANPHRSEKSARRFRELHRRWKDAEGKISKTAAEGKAKEEKLQKMEQEMAELKAGKGASDEEIKKEKEELMQYRRRYDLEKDPQIKQQFDERIKTTNDTIGSVLARNGVKKEDIEAIQREGGFNAYINANPSGAEEFLNSLGIIDRRKIETALTEQDLVTRAKDDYIKRETANASHWFEERDKAAAAEKAKQPDPAKTVELEKRVFENWSENVFKELPYFHEAEIPSDASAEVRTRIEKENQFARELKTTLKANLQPANLQEKVDIALSATLAFRLRRKLDEAEATLAALKKENTELKNADATTPRSGNSMTSGGTDTPKAEKFPSFSSALDKLERGGSLS
jgi:hypothetical protein